MHTYKPDLFWINKKVACGDQTNYFANLISRKPRAIMLWAIFISGGNYLGRKKSVQIHHEPCGYYQFGDKIQSEIRDYERLKSIGITIPKMLDVDIQEERILKEYIDGDTIFDLVKKPDGRKFYNAGQRNVCIIIPCQHQYRGIKYWSQTPEFIEYRNNH